MNLYLSLGEVCSFRLIIQPVSPAQRVAIMFHTFPRLASFPHVKHWFLRQRPHSLVGCCSDGFKRARAAKPRSMQSRSRRRRDRDRRHAILVTRDGVREPASREKPTLPLCPSAKVILGTCRDARRTCRAQCPSTRVTHCITPSLLQHLPSLMVHQLHLCTSWDVLDHAGCSGIRYHAWSSAMTYSAPPAVTYEAPPPVAPAMTYVGEESMQRRVLTSYYRCRTSERSKRHNHWRTRAS